MRAAYTGHEALTFSDYLDLETGRTLHAEPGGVYDVGPASGHVVPEFPDPWFAAVGEDGERLPEPEPQPEPQPELEPQPEGEQGEEGQQF